MIDGSRAFYPANRRVFDDPRSQFVIDDAERTSRRAASKFDLILSEPSNPWVSGVAGLFTTEFYGSVRTYLTPNGVFGQWLHLYEIDDGLVLSVVAALSKNFPSYSIFSELESRHPDRRHVAADAAGARLVDLRRAGVAERSEARLARDAERTMETLRVADNRSLRTALIHLAGACRIRISIRRSTSNAERARFMRSAGDGLRGAGGRRA